MTIARYGREIAKAAPSHMPNKLELCLVLYPDDDGTEMCYRTQFQIELIDGRAQVGLIDYGVTATVEISNIREFHEQFSFGCFTFLGKIRANIR